MSHMEKVVWSIDFSKKIRESKGVSGYDVKCAHCGAVTARIEAPDTCGMYAKEASSADHEYKRSAPEHLPEINHGQDIICGHCGNVAAVLRPIKNGMYA